MGQRVGSMVFLGFFLAAILTGCAASPAPVTPGPAGTTAPIAATVPASPTGGPAATPTRPAASPAAAAQPSPTQPPATAAAASTAQPGGPTSPVAAALVEVTPTAFAAPRDCTDLGVFIADITAPDGTLYDPGQAFVKTWRIQNVGTCAWDPGYRLVFAGGDQMNGPLENSLPALQPGESGEVSVALVAPPRGGQQVGYWKLRNPAGQEFGMGLPPKIPLWVNVNVAFFPLSNGAGPQLISYPLQDAAPCSPQDSGQDQPPAPDQPAAEDELQVVVLDEDPQDENAPDEGVEDENAQDQDAQEAGSQSSSAGSCSYQGSPAYLSQIVSLVNAARAQNGLTALALNSQLSAAAQLHSQDMGCKNYVDHTGSDGSTWFDRVRAQGYPGASSARENIYVGNPAFGGTAQGAFNWWMNSQVHRDNILFTSVTQIGVGYVFVNSSAYGGYYTLIVAR
ncbi:MAG: NBR1-Ig-like domain-containing protein [Chloroflexota bacterium]